MLKIKGFFGEYTQNQTSFIYVVTNEAQFNIAINIAKFCPEFIFYLNTPDSNWHLKKEEMPTNVFIVEHHKSLIPILDRVELVLLGVGHKNPVIPEWFQEFVRLAKEERKVLVEIPHGLFQWGYNFFDDSKVINYASNRVGAVTTKSFCEKQVPFLNGVGFPRDYGRADSLILPDYTVITTNTNWYLYSAEEERLLFSKLFQYAESNPNQLFIWSPHPSELGADSFCKYIINHRPKNILLYGFDKDIYFEGIDSTEKLISRAKFGISTTSTCLVDYVLCKIPMVHLKPSSFDYSDIASISIKEFIKMDMTEASFEPLDFPSITNFNASKFVNLVEQFISGEK